MKNQFIAILLSLIASICFFVAYFINKEILNFILGCVWLCIAIMNYINYKKNKG